MTGQAVPARTVLDDRYHDCGPKQPLARALPCHTAAPVGQQTARTFAIALALCSCAGVRACGDASRRCASAGGTQSGATRAGRLHGTLWRPGMAVLACARHLGGDHGHPVDKRLVLVRRQRSRRLSELRLLSARAAAPACAAAMAHARHGHLPHPVRQGAPGHLVGPARAACSHGHRESAYGLSSSAAFLAWVCARCRAGRDSVDDAVRYSFQPLSDHLSTKMRRARRGKRIELSLRADQG